MPPCPLATYLSVLLSGPSQWQFHGNSLAIAICRVPIHHRKKKIRMIPRSLLHVSIFVAIGLSVTACGDGKKAEAPAEERPVLVQAVRYAPSTAERGFVGSIRPRVESDLGFRVSGKVARRLVEVGDKVRAGQTLASLDEIDLGLQRDQAMAERVAARAALTNAEAEYRRVTTLRTQGWSATAVVDRARAASEEAKGRLARAEKSATLADNALSYATLMSEADGVVTAALIEPGQVVAAGQAAMRVARLDAKEVVIAIPESQVDWARTAKARVSLWSVADKSWGATLRELSPSADAATRTYLARYSLPDIGDAAVLGMTATLTLSDPGAAKVARVPLSALYNQGKGASVFVVDKTTGLLSLKPVDVETYDSREVVLTRGVSEGDLVVTMGVQKLEAGRKVRIIDALAF
jgi:RND family efflux transporter MFP subunit